MERKVFAAHQALRDVAKENKIVALQRQVELLQQELKNERQGRKNIGHTQLFIGIIVGFLAALGAQAWLGGGA